MKRFSADQLRTLRNEIPIHILIEKELKIPCKYSEGVFRFLCPLCGEFMASVKKETNLARCFVCNQNINTIELVMYDKKWKFVDSVKYLQNYYDASLKQSSRCSRRKVEAMEDNKNSGSCPQAIGDILKHCLSQDSVYENTSNFQKFEVLENKLDQLSKQVEQIRVFIITIARRLNGK
ncbi:MAG: DnaG5 [Candidatus Magnetoglobus multicellularis str. Araruama]|uniref:DnaG5 n=1 Tax=Candidatus Magnetoglobus multicellularis str. Araruama TaxID=890399 RepID=A0A1V1P5S0_9BACT|nr:MAG: DnaG5 [Candidatus Magnetoglobus multicellularis str. Araruama]